MSALGFKARVDPFTCFLTWLILRFTSGATPAECIGVSMAAQPFWSIYLQMCLQALVEVQGSNPWPSMLHIAQYCKPLGHSSSARSQQFKKSGNTANVQNLEVVKLVIQKLIVNKEIQLELKKAQVKKMH